MSNRFVRQTSWLAIPAGHRPVLQALHLSVSFPTQPAICNNNLPENTPFAPRHISLNASAAKLPVCPSPPPANIGISPCLPWLIAAL